MTIHKPLTFLILLYLSNVYRTVSAVARRLHYARTTIARDTTSPSVTTQGEEMTTMKRYVVVLMVLTLLSLPLVARADDQTIPPEANWSPYPPARSTVDAGQLTDVLVQKGVLTPVDRSDLTKSQNVPPTKSLREMYREYGIEYVPAQ